MNTIGRLYRFTDFGESHGSAVGGVIDGCPSGVTIDFVSISNDLSRRAGRDIPFASARAQAEPDEIEWLSGLSDGVTLGTPIAFIIRNKDTRAEDYEALRDSYRFAHADMTYQVKYGIRDWRGGGRASARETVARVVAGVIAKQILLARGITIHAAVTQVGEETEENKIDALLRRVSQTGDSVGGIVECVVQHLPIGVGEPIFDKLPARLAYAVMSVNACKGFDYGTGFEGVGKLGSEANSISGGTLGGISDGKDLHFRAVFKPTPTIRREAGGRHDVCVALRAPVIVEAMAAMTVLDMLLEARL